MSYTKVYPDWKDEPDQSTPVTAAVMEHIEQGIAEAASDADTANSRLDALGTASAHDVTDFAPASEADARAAAVDNLQDQINNTNEDVDAVAADVATTNTALTAEANRATAAEGVLDTRLDAAEEALPLKADLVGGKVPTSQMMPVSIFKIQQVADQAARLALPAGESYMVKQVDTSDWWALDSSADPAVSGNWINVDVNPNANVESVNGQVGPVLLGPADVGADAAGAASTAQANAIAAAALDATTKANDAISAAAADATTKASNAQTAAIAAAATDATTKANAAQAAAQSFATDSISALELGTMSKMVGLQSNFTVINSSGNAIVNRENYADATAGEVDLTLPAGQPAMTWCKVEKKDASTNVVKVIGNLRGVAGQSISLALQGEHVFLITDSTGSWGVFAHGYALTTLDSRYQAAGTAAGAGLAYAELATSAGSFAVSSASWTDLPGLPLAVAPNLPGGTTEYEISLLVQCLSAATINVGIFDATAGGNPIGAGAGTFAAGAFLRLTAKIQVNPAAGVRSLRPQLKAASGTPSCIVYGMNVNNILSNIFITKR